jgi:hypothetical protein
LFKNVMHKWKWRLTSGTVGCLFSQILFVFITIGVPSFRSNLTFVNEFLLSLSLLHSKKMKIFNIEVVLNFLLRTDLFHHL